jgi:hypothetical protein
MFFVSHRAYLYEPQPRLLCRIAPGFSLMSEGCFQVDKGTVSSNYATCVAHIKCALQPSSQASRQASKKKHFTVRRVRVVLAYCDAFGRPFLMLVFMGHHQLLYKSW